MQFHYIEKLENSFQVENEKLVKQASNEELVKKLGENEKIMSKENCWQLKQISALESDLHDERKLKNEAVNLNEKLELALYDLEIKLEQVKDELAMVSENLENKLKIDEMQAIQVQMQKDLAEKQHNQGLSERDDLKHELDSIVGEKYVK